MRLCTRRPASLPSPSRNPSRIRKEQPTAYGYAFHSALSAKEVERVNIPAMTPALFDSTVLARSAVDDGSTYPLSPPRHAQGANVGMVDGRVEYRTSFPTGPTVR